MTEMSDLSTNRILIVDDREENRYITRRMLESAGYECFEAETGRRALEAARKGPGLIVLDTRLPDLSGFEVCRLLKSSADTATIPVLQVSASFTSIEDRVRALEGGADAYLTHPVDRTVLIATIRALLRLRTAEMEARRSAQHWQATFDALAEGLALVDERGRLTRWNRGFAKIAAAAGEPAAGEDAKTYFHAWLGEQSLFENGGSNARGEFDLGAKSVEVSINRIDTSLGPAERIVVLSDVTDRKLAEYAMRTAEKLAATGKLANAIAHEINNPLEAITNLLYLARQSADVDAIQGLLTHANNELERISRITKQTLAFHRETQFPVSVDVGALILQVVELYEKASTAKRTRIACSRRPALAIHGFPGQLSQVFANLVRNAIDAAPIGSCVDIRVRQIHRCGRVGTRVTIHDCGEGIPESLKARLFDPFFTTKELKGSGLGLWVAKNLISKHNGTIRFRTSRGELRHGTVFEVFLPVRGSAEQELSYPSSPSSHSAE